MKPSDQIHTFLSWFCLQGSRAFDLHLRVPKTQNEDYKNGNWIWLTHHEAVDFNHITSKLWEWIRYKNTTGADIYFRAHRNNLHRIIFLDDVPTNKALKIMQKYGACVIETHPGNTQIWLKTNRKLDINQRKQAQVILKDLGFTDPGSVSGDHLGRICGVKSQKRNCWVNLIGTSDLKPWVPDFQKTKTAPSLPPIGGACASPNIAQAGYDTSASGREWGWILGMLRNGKTAEDVTRQLIETAVGRGKQNPVKYAEYTVRKALSKFMSK